MSGTERARRTDGVAAPPGGRARGNPAAAARRGQRGRRHGDGDRAGHEGRPVVRSLLQAAGIAPVTGADTVGNLTDSGGVLCGLPLVDMFDSHADGTRVWAGTTVNDRGRLADRTPLNVLGWEPGTRVTLSTLPAAGIVLVRRGGPDAVTSHGFLRLSADVRRGCRIHGGDRLLMVAHPTDDVLVLYTAYAVDAMTTAYHASIQPGEGR